MSDLRRYRKDSGERASNPGEWQSHDLVAKVREVPMEELALPVSASYPFLDVARRRGWR